MVFTAYYNKENSTVIIATKTVENPSIETVGNVTVLRNDNEVVGLNIKTDREFSSHLIDANEFAAEIKEYYGDVEIEFPFVYGEIMTCEAHPKSTKLQICQIDIAQEELVQIVCGAANCAAGNMAIVARVGAVMPTGMSIVPSKLIDVASSGMLCSNYELGLEQVAKKGIALFSIDEKTKGAAIL